MICIRVLFELSCNLNTLHSAAKGVGVWTTPSPNHLVLEGYRGMHLGCSKLSAEHGNLGKCFVKHIYKCWREDTSAGLKEELFECLYMKTLVVL